jgi:ketosteroid isomerase-like protein
MIGAIIAKQAMVKAFQAMDNHDLKTFMSAWRADAVFIYPGEIHASGTFEGKEAIEGWFRKFFEQFPKIHFDLLNICVQNIFAMSGNNVAAVHWDLHLTNREGRVAQNSGVTILNIEDGKVARVKDFIFDLGMNFKLNWSAA